MVHIEVRPTWWKKMWQVHGVYVYKCPESIEKKEHGFSPDVNKNPLDNPVLLKELLDAADRDAIRKAKIKCFGKNYEKKKLPVFYREFYDIIAYVPQKQSKITDFTPNTDYHEKKAEFELNEDREATANQIYRKENPEIKRYSRKKFVSEGDYNFLTAYYNFDKQSFSKINRNERIKLGMKYKGVIDSWGTVSERKKELDQKKKQKKKAQKSQ